MRFLGECQRDAQPPLEARGEAALQRIARLLVLLGV